MAEVSSAGHVLEKTTRTRIIPEAQSAQPIDYWEYIERQKLPDPDHLLYLYLQRENRNIPYGTYTSHIQMRDGKLVPIDDREAFEAGVQARFGGGIWRLILKCGKQRKCETRIFTGDGPTYPPPTDAQEMQNMPAGSNGRFGAQPPQMDASTQIASKAMDVVAGQEHQAVNLGLGMMTTAADVMRRFAERSINADPLAAPAPGPEADLRNALTQALVARLAADPLQQVAQTLALMREITNGNGGGGGGGINRQLDEFRSVFSFARELISGSMAPAAAANGSTGAAIVNVLPGIVSAGVDIARAWQVGKEAERDAVAMATRQAPAAGRPGSPAPIVAQRSPFESPAARPVLPPQAGIPQPMLQANPSPAPGPPAAGAIVPPSTEFIESRITEIIRCQIPAEEAASRALEFLHTLSGENPAVSYVTQLVVLGETGLVNLFHMRPILKPATNDMARLLEFIRAFLKYNAEEEALRAQNKDRKPN